MATIVRSNAQAFAVATTWPSSVPSPKGRSCLGRPRRFDPPAPSTSPVTNGSIGGGMLVGRLELLLAAPAAEVHDLALVLQRERRGHGGHGHPADRIDRGR